MQLKRLLMVTGVLAGSVAFSGTAMASSYLISNFSVTIWNASTPNGDLSTFSNLETKDLCQTFGECPSQQAMPNGYQPIVTSANEAVTFTYSQPTLDFSTSGNTIDSFLGSAPIPGGFSNVSYNTGFSSATTLSQTDFALASVFKFSFTLNYAASGTIAHDDGVALFNAGTACSTANACALADLWPTDLSYPQGAQVNPYFFTLGPGTYDLWYAEVNGAPAQLNFAPVPEPGSLGMLGLGLSAIGALGWIRRRRSQIIVK